jgi:5,10-methylenetetrahydromethanopterin reductase
VSNALPDDQAGSAQRRPALSVGYYPSDDVETCLRIARTLDGGLVDTLWIGDSPLIWREVWASIALCLASTETLRYGTAVTNPLSRHWSVTASVLQTLNEYSPGRVRLGIGVGDSALRRLGGNVAKLAELREAVAAIRALLAGKEVEGFTGLSWDKSPQDVEVLLSGSGPKTLELAGEIGDGTIIVPGIEPQQVEQVLEAVATGSRSAGRDPRSVRNVLWVACAVRDDEEEAWADVRPWVASVLRHPLAFRTSPEVDAARERIRAGYDFSHHMSHESDHGDILPTSVLRDFAVAGTEEQVAKTLREISSLPVDEIGLVLMGRDVVDQATRVNRLINAAWDPR